MAPPVPSTFFGEGRLRRMASMENQQFSDMFRSGELLGCASWCRVMNRSEWPGHASSCEPPAATQSANSAEVCAGWPSSSQGITCHAGSPSMRWAVHICEVGGPAGARQTGPDGWGLAAAGGACASGKPHVALPLDDLGRREQLDVQLRVHGPRVEHQGGWTGHIVEPAPASDPNLCAATARRRLRARAAPSWWAGRGARRLGHGAGAMGGGRPWARQRRGPAPLCAHQRKPVLAGRARWSAGTRRARSSTRPRAADR